MWNGLVQVCSEASPRNWSFGNMWHLIMLFKLKVANQEICTLAWTLSPSPRSFLLALDKSGSRKWRQWWHLYAIFSLHVKWTIPGYSEASSWNRSWTFGNVWHLIMLLKLEVAVQEICTLFESSDCWCPQGPTNLWWGTAKVLVACLLSQIWFGFDLLKDFLELFDPFSLPTGLSA